MLKKLNDQDFESFINASFYSAVGFYRPGTDKADEMLKVMEMFVETHGNVASAEMDITGQVVPGDYGVTEDESPVIVVFKQGKPTKAVNEFTVENLANAIAPPGKNITLQ
ncbi:hypothetical protein CEB3_c17020 [Peptococcaceae bacterium CEB3]|nr:hypothetical protein CEB3_c17020 [Peptococcaceae bacterium CEB3]